MTELTVTMPSNAGLPVARWSLRSVLVPAVSLGLALPITLSIGGVSIVGAMAQSIAVATVFLLLPVQLPLDAASPRRGSWVRLLVLFLCLTSSVSWAAGVAERGLSGGALLSMLNWVALGGMVVCGQVLFSQRRHLEWCLGAWCWVQTLIAAGSILYLVSRFGTELLATTSRSPFQVAMHDILSQWPNGAGLAFAVTASLCYGRIRGGQASGTLWLQLFVLLAGVLVTFSRNAWLSGGAGILLMTLVSGGRRQAMRLFLVAVAFVLVLALLLPTVRYQVVASVMPGSSQQSSILERLAFAGEAIRVWQEHPLTGIGFARFEEFASLARLSAGSALSASYVPGSVHDEYLSVLLKGGLLSAASFVTFLVAAWRLLYRRASRLHNEGWRTWALAGVGVMTVLIVGGAGAESFRLLYVSAPFWILTGSLSMVDLPAGVRRLTILGRLRGPAGAAKSVHGGGM